MSTKHCFLISVIFLLISCSTSFKNISSNPPVLNSFSFLSIDPNNTDSDYLQRMKKYDNIIKDCPIPLCVIKQQELPKEILKSINKKYGDLVFCGLYYNKKSYDGFYSEFIFIDERCAPEHILSTYFHEYTHYLHEKNKCICFINKDICLGEEHALLGELELGVEHSDLYAISSSIAGIYLYILTEETPISYKIAALRVLKSDQFKKAKQLIAEYEKKYPEKFDIIYYE